MNGEAIGPYELGRVHHGDALECLRHLPDGCVDAVVTDPPYALTAASRRGSPRMNDPETPFGRPRRGSDRGFMGKTWDGALPPLDVWAEALRVAKPGAHLLAFGGTRTFHRLACAVEDAGWEIRDCLSWLYGQGFPKSLDVSKAIDREAGAEREVVGSRKLTGTARIKGGQGGATSGHADDLYATHEIRGVLPLTKPSTPAARQWSGWGTALKPAWEPIILARKPLVGTVAANVQRHGTGAINVDGCRIGTDGGGTQCTNRGPDGRCLGHKNAGRSTSGETFHGQDGGGGRFPANLVLDEAAAAMLDEEAGETTDGVAGKRSGVAHVTLHGLGGQESAWGGYGGLGGPSRFFYTAKATRSERDEGGALLTVRDEGGAQHTKGVRLAVNDHPTVKPLSLMRWLCRLVTPPGGIILDPFSGSGTTGCATRLEGFRFVGFDQDAHYCEIANARIAATSERLGEVRPSEAKVLQQVGMFSEVKG